MSRPFAQLVMGLLFFGVSTHAADIDGIWVGQQPARNSEVEDVAFHLKSNGNSITGKMFGDEFDLPISEGPVDTRIGVGVLIVQIGLQRGALEGHRSPPEIDAAGVIGQAVRIAINHVRGLHDGKRGLR